MPRIVERPKLNDGGHCVWFKDNKQHYHTRALTEEDKRWYLDRKWTIARFCQNTATTGLKGNPDQTWNTVCDLSDGDQREEGDPIEVVHTQEYAWHEVSWNAAA